MKHRRLSDPLNTWLAVAAALVVLFSSMLDAHVAFLLSIGVALMFATIKLLQSRRSFE
jgi:CHASE1-domain containing sensor protein